jgi:PAS domain S-box-containing protein
MIALGKITAMSGTSIRHRLVWGSIALIVASFVVCAVSIYLTVYRPLLSDHTSLEMRRASERVAGDIQTIFAQVAGIAARDRDWGMTGVIALDDLPLLNRLIGPLFSGSVGVTSVAIAQDSGREVLILSSSGECCLDRLTNPDAWGREARFMTWDQRGNLMSSERREVDYDARRRRWFIDAMAQPGDDGIYWTPPYKFVSTQELGISAVVRWHAADSHRYAMTTDIRLLDLTRLTQQISFGKSGVAAVLTEDGTVLGVPRDPCFEDIGAVKKALLSHVDNLAIAPLTAAFSAWRTAARPDGSVLSFEADGATWLAMFTLFRLGDQTFWIATLAPSADFGTLTGDTLALGIALVLGSMVIAGSGAIWLGGRFTRPIEQLTAESARIGRMDLDHPITVKSPAREIGVLAQSLDRMRRNLSEARTELEARVEIEREAKRAERESNELLAESQRLGKLGYIVSDRANNRVSWSESLFELRKVAPREFFTIDEGQAFLHPDDRDRYAKAREQAIAERRNAETEVRIYRGDGSLGWERGITRPRYDAAGNCVGTLLVVRDVTEEKLADEALRRKDIDLRAIMDNAPVAIFLKDTEGRYRLVNRRFERWVGRSTTEIVGRTDTEIAPGESTSQIRASDLHVLERGEIHQMARQPTRRESVDQQILVTKFPIRDGADRITGIAGFAIDVTEHQRAETALRQREHDLRAITDNAPIAIFLKDTQGRYRLVNRCYADWFRSEPEALYGRTSEEVIPPELANDMDAGDQLLLDGGEISEVEIATRSVPHKPGLEHVLITKFPVRDDHGVIVGIAGFSIDITARKRAEDKLRQSEERFRALIEHSSDMVTVITGEGRVTYRSPASAEQLGYAEEEFMGGTVFDRAHPDDVAELAALLKRLAADPSRRARGRTRVRHKNGTWRTFAWSARAASHVSSIEGIIFNARDVTEAEALEERLHEAQKMEAVGQLAGGIAHDFNNILGAILGFANFLLQDLPTGTPEHGFAERIATAGQRGKDLVRQILAFAQRGIVERKPADLGALVEEASDLVRASIPSSTHLDVAVSEKGLIGEVNAAQISQVLFNLCLNANDALMGEPGRIAVTLRRLELSAPERALMQDNTAKGGGRLVIGSLQPNTEYARIAIADTGSGMKQDVLLHVFDPFFTTKGRSRGTGLGLAVVHGIVMAYNGALMVTSRPGEGSTFIVYLPLSGAVADTKPDGGSGSTLRGRERVLIVDDENDIADVLAMGLERLGYEVVALNDPEEAIAAFLEEPDAWDAVISDQVMPKMKGLSLLARLRQIRPSLRFILWTGFSDELTAESARAAGVDAFFIKPASAEDVAAALRQFFDRPAASSRV